MSIAALAIRPDLPATTRIALRPLAEAAVLLRDRLALHRLPPFDGIATGDAAAEFAAVSQDDREDIAAFALSDVTNGRICGWASLMAIDQRHRHAELGPAWWAGAADPRIGCHGVHLLLRMAFETLGLVRVEAQVIAADCAGCRVLDRLAFVREGTRRAGRCAADGRPDDVAPWSVVAARWPATARMQRSFLDEQDTPWRGRLPSIMPP